MLVNSKEMLLKAKKEHYAVPSANIIDSNTIHGVLDASRELDLPIIISLAEVHTEYFSIKECAALVKKLAEDHKQKVVLHYDHGFTISKVKEAIDEGFTSVMIDGSSLPYEKNVAQTRDIVEYAHKKNVTVEAEIGHVGGGESYIDPTKDKSMLTTVEEAIKFADDTGVDSLAVSIGTAHGEYKGVPNINFERLSEIANSINIPLVLHGGSGSGDENLSKTTKLGICKINIFTDLANAARDSSKDGYAIRSYVDSCMLARQGYTNKLMHYYNVFGTQKD